MNNFDDPNETQFSGYQFSRARIRRMGPGAIMMRLETAQAPQSPSPAPSLQVGLTAQQARDLGTSLLRLADMVTAPRPAAGAPNRPAAPPA